MILVTEMKGSDPPIIVPIQQGTTSTQVFATLLVSLVTIAVYYLLCWTRKTKTDDEQLEGLDEKLAAFNPEPLITLDHEYIEQEYPKEIDSSDDKSSPKGFSTVQDLICGNHLNLLQNKEIKDVAANWIKKVGVGACGPRCFYGTMDVHIELENRLRDFYGGSQGMVYAYGLATMSSILMLYCKAETVVFCDEEIMETTKHSLTTTKVKTIYFKHNDVKDLEAKIIKHNSSNVPKKELHQFLVVEGIYMATGQICPLPELVAIREKYKMRFILDESLSFSTIGAHGKGLTEYYNVKPTDIDFIVGNMESAIPSSGGFCMTNEVHVEHMRLNNLAFCFSASLPPFLCVVSIHVLDLFQKSPELFEKLNENANVMHKNLCNVKGVEVTSHKDSAFKVFKTSDVKAAAEKCKKKGLIILAHNNTLTFNVNIMMDNEYITKVCEIIEWACK